MKNRICRLLRAALFLSLPLATQPAMAQLQWAWLKAANATSDSQEPAAIATDAQGNLFASGYLRAGTATDTVRFGNGITLTVPPYCWASFIVAYAPSGTCRWATRLLQGTRYRAYIPTVAQLATDAAGNVLVSGYCTDSTWFGNQFVRHPGSRNFYDQQGFVGKLNVAGQWQWVATLQGAYGWGVRPATLLTDSTGNCYLAGQYIGDTLKADTFALGAGTGGGNFVGKLNAAGQWQWLRGLGSAMGSAGITAMQLDRAGDVYVTGVTDTTIAFGPDTLTGPGWFNQPTVPGAPPTVMFSFVARLSATGQWRWGQRTDGLLASALGRSPGGDLLLAGLYQTPVPVPIGSDTLRNQGVFVLNLSPQGVWRRIRHRELPVAVDWYRRPVIDSNGLTYLIGSNRDRVQFDTYALPADPQRAFYVAALDDANQWRGLTDATTTSPGDIVVRQVVAGPQGVYFTGGHTGTAHFGALNHTSGNDPYFLARLSTPLLGVPATAAVSTLQLFPNPAHGSVQLTTPTGGVAQVLDALGRVVRTSHLAPGTSALSLQGVPPGFYTVRAGVAVRKLVVE